MGNLCSFYDEPEGGLSTCSLDVILIPLPTWFLLFFIYLYLFQSPRPGYRTENLPKWISIGYLFFLLAFIGMASLEIARLAVANLGVGMLPFTLVGLGIAFAMVYLRNKDGRRCAAFLAPYFLLLSTMEALKVHRLIEIQRQIDTIKGSKYPVSDWLTDVIVMLALSALCAILEIILLFRRTNNSTVIATTNVTAGLPATEMSLNHANLRTTSDLDLRSESPIFNTPLSSRTASIKSSTTPFVLPGEGQGDYRAQHYGNGKARVHERERV